MALAVFALRGTGLKVYVVWYSFMLVENPRKKKHQDSLFTQIQVKEIDPLTLRIATPFRRIAATLLNVLLPFTFFAIAVIYNKTHRQIGDVFILCIPIWFIMQFFLMLFLRQTFGKWVMKIKVVDSQSRKKISFCRYLLREFIGIILYTVFPLTILIDTIVLLKSGELNTFSRSIISSTVVSTHLTNDT
ncbi:RDD family protein [Aggregatibacter actinomycetemcomitans]|nr:RDD family protein [Aggregatibacter actinomycetemcomitans]